MKYCKTCKEPFEPKQKYNSTIKTNRCDVCLKTAQALKNLSAIKKEKKIKQKEDLLTLQDYLKLAQQVFNAWIRQRDKGLNCISVAVNLARKRMLVIILVREDTPT
jgi:hypothetical protein